MYHIYIHTHTPHTHIDAHIYSHTYTTHTLYRHIYKCTDMYSHMEMLPTDKPLVVFAGCESGR